MLVSNNPIAGQQFSTSKNSMRAVAGQRQPDCWFSNSLNSMNSMRAVAGQQQPDSDCCSAILTFPEFNEGCCWSAANSFAGQQMSTSVNSMRDVSGQQSTKEYLLNF